LTRPGERAKLKNLGHSNKETMEMNRALATRQTYAVMLVAIIAGCALSSQRANSSTGDPAESDPAALAVTPDARVEQDDSIDVDVNTIADKFDERYRNAKFLHLEGRTVTSMGHDLRYVHDTSRDSLRTVCHSGDELVGAFSMHNGRVQEFVPAHPKRLLLEYDAEDNLQVPNRVYRDERDCFYGFCFVIRIGPETPHRQGYVDRIRECTLKGQEKVGDSTCHVLEWSQLWPNDQGVEIASVWTYYVDVADFTIRRRHVINSTTRNGEVIDRQERDFRYDVVRLFDEVPPQAFDWDMRAIAENAPKPTPEDKPAGQPEGQLEDSAEGR
jgi:hypothetical protein